MTLNLSALEEQLNKRGRWLELENGVCIIAEDLPGSGLVKGTIHIAAGEFHEGKKQGVAHRLEHMLFNAGTSKGTYERGMQAALLGLSLNGETGPEETKYSVGSAGDYEILGVLQRDFPKALEIVRNLVFYPEFTQQALEKERAIVQREAEIEYDEPLEAFERRVNTRLFGMNPFTYKDIELHGKARLSINDFKRFHTRYYCGKNSTVVLVGDLNGDCDILGQVKALMKDLPAGEKAQPVIYRKEEPFRPHERMETSSETHVKVEIRIDYQLPAYRDTDSPALQYAQFILGRGMHSLVMQKMREKNWFIYDLVCECLGGEEEKTRYLEFEYMVDPKNVARSIASIDECIAKLQAGDWDSRLFQAARNTLEIEFLAEWQEPGWIVHELYKRNNLKRDPFEEYRKLCAVTRDDVIRVANTYLGEKRLEVIIYPE